MHKNSLQLCIEFSSEKFKLNENFAQNNNNKSTLYDYENISNCTKYFAT